MDYNLINCYVVHFYRLYYSQYLLLFNITISKEYVDNINRDLYMSFLIFVSKKKDTVTWVSPAFSKIKFFSIL